MEDIKARIVFDALDIETGAKATYAEGDIVDAVTADQPETVIVGRIAKICLVENTLTVDASEKFKSDVHVIGFGNVKSIVIHVDTKPVEIPAVQPAPTEVPATQPVAPEATVSPQQVVEPAVQVETPTVAHTETVTVQEPVVEAGANETSPVAGPVEIN